MGICWHSPFTLREWIGQWRDGLAPEQEALVVTQMLDYSRDQVLKDDLLILFVPSMDVYLRNREAIEACDAVVVLFSTAIVMAQAAIPVLDAVTRDRIRWERVDMDIEQFTLHLRAALRGERPVDPRGFDLVPNLIDNAAGSLTEALLNLTGGCRVPERRREITIGYVDWLLSRSTIDVLEARLRGLNVDEDSITYVVGWLQSKPGGAARGVMTRIAALRGEGKSINYEKLCAKTGVQPFDIRYLLRYARGASVQAINMTSAEMFAVRGAEGAPPTAEELAQATIIQDEIDSGGSLDVLDFTSLETIEY